MESERENLGVALTLSRFGAMASSSSMKIMAGAFFSASSKAEEENKENRLSANVSTQKSGHGTRTKTSGLNQRHAQRSMFLPWYFL